MMVKSGLEFILFAVKNKKAKKTNFPFVFLEKLADHKLLSRLTDLWKEVNVNCLVSRIPKAQTFSKLSGKKSPHFSIGFF